MNQWVICTAQNLFSSSQLWEETRESQPCYECFDSILVMLLECKMQLWNDGNNLVLNQQPFLFYRYMEVWHRENKDVRRRWVSKTANWGRYRPQAKTPKSGPILVWWNPVICKAVVTRLKKALLLSFPFHNGCKGTSDVLTTIFKAGWVFPYTEVRLEWKSNK